MGETNHPCGLGALARPLRTSFFPLPSFLLLCTFSSHRLPLSIFQLVAADLYLNPNICPIQHELCIQPNAWWCLCSFEQTEWATWLGDADIAWSLVVFVRIDQMQQGKKEREEGVCVQFSFQHNRGEENEIVYFPGHNYKLSLCSSKQTLSLAWIKWARNQRRWILLKAHNFICSLENYPL